MKKIIFYFIVLLGAVWLGVTVHSHPGYVLISYHNISIETSLWFAIATLIFLFLFFHLLLQLSQGIIEITALLKQWVSNRKKRRAHTQTVLGLYELIEGDWRRAEKRLARAAKYSDMPLINYLAAALMAQNQHELKRRDNYLSLAQKVAEDRPIAMSLTQASLHMGNQQWEEAAATLQYLQQLQPKNILVLQLLYKVYTELKDWQHLAQLLPLLRKRRVLTAEELNQLALQVYQELLLSHTHNHTIKNIWRSLPRYLQKNPSLAVIYAKHLIANEQLVAAEDMLKTTLQRVLDEQALELYATLPSTQPIKQLTRAEAWLQDNQDHAALLLCLGRLCKHQKLWGKARYYLEKSAKLKPALAVYAELAQIMNAQNDLPGALAWYEKGYRLLGQGITK